MTSMPPEQSQTSISLEILEHNSDGDDDQLLVVRSPDAWNHPVLYSRPSTPLFPRIPSPLLHLTFSRPESTLAAPDFISRQHAVLDSASQELTALDLAIDKGADLSKPLKATCDALQAVIRITTVKLNIEVDEDWIRLIKKLRFHLATVESQLVKLEEDQKTDKSALPFDQAVRESLRSYSRQVLPMYLPAQGINAGFSKLRSIYGLAGQKDIVPQHNTGIIGEALRELDIRFNRYTKALHVFIASTVEYMNKDIPKAGRMSLKKALETHSSRPENINAYGAQHRQCQPGTRTKTLDAIRQWADGDDPPSWMFCLLDFAGSGKSTVSKHMDREWDKDRKLIARFFFSRDTTDTMSTKWFCSIVADAFAFRDENFKAIMKEFQRQPNYGLLSFEQQFEGLIVDPLKALDRRAILIIDALDECDNDNGDRDQLLDTISNQLRSIPHLRVFVTGRPERDITQWAASTVGVRHANFLQLEGGHGDVEKYIKQRLFNFPSHLQAQVSHVVEKAEGVFIWARIACDLLCKAIDKQALLNSLGKEVTLDYLYTIALEQSVPRDSYSHQATIMVLGMILAVRRPLSIDELASLSPNPDVVEAVVTSLGSILIYRHRNEPIRLIHATLREFLTTMTKAEPWFVQLGPGHYTLADRCIDLLARATRTEQGSGPNIKENTFQRKEGFE
ncbi:hypothetical protein FRC18_004401 [Serendipita sp. 400]|nr:hypothetical protein FRC18_004401 [Serendipita sp. 400]